MAAVEAHRAEEEGREELTESQAGMALVLKCKQHVHLSELHLDSA